MKFELSILRIFCVFVILAAVSGIVYCITEIVRIEGIYHKATLENEFAGALLTPTFLARKQSLQVWIAVWVTVIFLSLIVDLVSYFWTKKLKHEAAAKRCPHCVGALPLDARPTACCHCGRALVWFEGEPRTPDVAQHLAKQKKARRAQEAVQAARHEQQLAQYEAELQERLHEEKIQREAAYAARLNAATNFFVNAWGAWKNLLGTTSSGIAAGTLGVLVGFVVTVVVLLSLLVSGDDSGDRPSGAASEEGGTVGDEAGGIEMQATLPNSGAQVASGDIPPVEPFIPGLAAADIQFNLSKRGFKNTAMDTLPDGYVQWTCQESTQTHQFTVEIFGRGTSKIESVRATSLFFGPHSSTDHDDSAREFLSFVASLPFDGASPAEAKAWATRNVGRNASISFGNVDFSLAASPSGARILTLTAPSRRKVLSDKDRAVSDLAENPAETVSRDVKPVPEATSTQRTDGASSDSSKARVVWQFYGSRVLVDLLTESSSRRYVYASYFDSAGDILSTEKKTLQETENQVVFTVNFPGAATCRLRVFDQTGELLYENEQPRKTSDEFSSFRVWTSGDGKFKTEARLVEFADGIVSLQKLDGSTVQVPSARLSQDDQEFLNEYERR